MGCFGLDLRGPAATRSSLPASFERSRLIATGVVADPVWVVPPLPQAGPVVPA